MIILAVWFMLKLEGVFVPHITPFDINGEIELLDKLARHPRRSSLPLYDTAHEDVTTTLKAALDMGDK